MQCTSFTYPQDGRLQVPKVLLAVAKPELASLLQDVEEPTLIVTDTQLDNYVNEIVRQVFRNQFSKLRNSDPVFCHF